MEAPKLKSMVPSVELCTLFLTGETGGGCQYEGKEAGSEGFPGCWRAQIGNLVLSVRHQLVWQTAQPRKRGCWGMEELLFLSSSQCENKGSILTHLPDFQGMPRIWSLSETYKFLNAEQNK